MNVKAKIKEEISELVGRIKPSLIQHLPSLKLKKNQLVRRDHYGLEIKEDWLAEMDYFCLRVLMGGNQSAFDDMKSKRNTGGSMYTRVISIIDYAAANFHVPTENLVWSELDPIHFETQCAKSLADVGWDARTTKASGDQGIDIIAMSNGVKLVVQCKRYKDQVGNQAVQEIIAGREFERAQFAAVVSTGEFTRSAIQLASSTNVLLLHPDQIESLLNASRFDSYARNKIFPAEVIDFDEMISGMIESVSTAEYESRLSSSARVDHGHDDGSDDDEDSDDDEEMTEEIEIEKAIRHIKTTRCASTSSLQRGMRIGYHSATRLMDELAARGYLGPENGASPRIILPKFDEI